MTFFVLGSRFSVTFDIISRYGLKYLCANWKDVVKMYKYLIRIKWLLFIIIRHLRSGEEVNYKDLLSTATHRPIQHGPIYINIKRCFHCNLQPIDRMIDWLKRMDICFCTITYFARISISNIIIIDKNKILHQLFIAISHSDRERCLNWSKWVTDKIIIDVCCV